MKHQPKPTLGQPPPKRHRNKRQPNTKHVRAKTKPPKPKHFGRQGQTTIHSPYPTYHHPHGVYAFCLSNSSARLCRCQLHVRLPTSPYIPGVNCSHALAAECRLNHLSVVRSRVMPDGPTESELRRCIH
ncbi:hypothetical protein BDN71DRAFT_1020510 [Pleurotus eryngii]|uniref:Uncharacterized protein n=1 Tax=Pleurotus eryngii TaxID=5323 RepID=A0A9P5ZVQ7_PLEER|nr:hypothetical protein BDN71DRAFT_1020510 [Pleurotus eryngii]